MFAVRIHGRRGQGVATTARVLSVAAFHGGHYAQAHNGFWRERPGSPVTAFCRIADMPIRTGERMPRPDAILIFDARLLDPGRRGPGLPSGPPALTGLTPAGYLLVNSAAGLGELHLRESVRQLSRDRVLVVPATGLALDHLGRPLPGTVLLGGLAALTGVISLEQLATALHERFARRLAEDNTAAARAGYEFVRAEQDALTGAQVE